MEGVWWEVCMEEVCLDGGSCVRFVWRGLFVWRGSGVRFVL